MSLRNRNLPINAKTKKYIFYIILGILLVLGALLFLLYFFIFKQTSSKNEITDEITATYLPLKNQSSYKIYNNAKNEQEMFSMTKYFLTPRLKPTTELQLKRKYLNIVENWENTRTHISVVINNAFTQPKSNNKEQVSYINSAGRIIIGLKSFNTVYNILNKFITFIKDQKLNKQDKSKVLLYLTNIILNKLNKIMLYNCLESEIYRDDIYLNLDLLGLNAKENEYKKAVMKSILNTYEEMFYISKDELILNVNIYKEPIHTLINEESLLYWFNLQMIKYQLMMIDKDLSNIKLNKHFSVENLVNTFNDFNKDNKIDKQEIESLLNDIGNSIKQIFDLYFPAKNGIDKNELNELNEKFFGYITKLEGFYE